MKAQEILVLMWEGIKANDTYPTIYSEMNLTEHEAKEWLHNIMNNKMRLMADYNYKSGMYEPSLAH